MVRRGRRIMRKSGEQREIAACFPFFVLHRHFSVPPQLFFLFFFPSLFYLSLHIPVGQCCVIVSASPLLPFMRQDSFSLSMSCHREASAVHPRVAFGPDEVGIDRCKIAPAPSHRLQWAEVKRPPPERTGIVSSILTLNGGKDKKAFGAAPHGSVD